MPLEGDAADGRKRKRAASPPLVFPRAPRGPGTGARAKAVAISMCLEDVERMDRLVAARVALGLGGVSRSSVVREALEDMEAAEARRLAEAGP
jgi:hypothetical protein